MYRNSQNLICVFECEWIVFENGKLTRHEGVKIDNEIYIVRGYLGELFDQLLYKYPMIKFLENPVYNE